MIGRLEAPGGEGGAGNAGFGEQEIAELGGARAADFLVRHHGDGCELVRNDGKHALLKCGSSRRWLRLWRALAIAAGSGPGDAHGRTRGTTVRCRTIGLGAVTVISGSCVAEDGAGVASWAVA